MPAPKYRSRTYRRVFRKTPGGRTVLQYRRRKPGKPQCASCGIALHGVARGTPGQVRAMPKSSRRPERPFGGMLCSRCARQEIVRRARA